MRDRARELTKTWLERSMAISCYLHIDDAAVERNYGGKHGSRLTSKEERGVFKAWGKAATPQDLNDMYAELMRGFSQEQDEAKF